MSNFTPFEQDQLVEIINIGASNASTALSQMIGMQVKANIPDQFIGHVEKIHAFIGQPEKVITAILLKVFGDIFGTALLVFPPESAFKLVKLLTKDPRMEETVLDEFGRSALREVGNILLGASLSAFSKFLGMRILQSVPDIATDMLGSVIDAVIAEMGETSDIILGFKVDLAIEDESEKEPIHLQLFFVFDPSTTAKILDKAGKKLA